MASEKKHSFGGRTLAIMLAAAMLSSMAGITAVTANAADDRFPLEDRTFNVYGNLTTGNNNYTHTDMSDEDGDGIYELTIEDVAAGSYRFKVYSDNNQFWAFYSDYYKRTRDTGWDDYINFNPLKDTDIKISFDTTGDDYDQWGISYTFTAKDGKTKTVTTDKLSRYKSNDTYEYVINYDENGDKYITITKYLLTEETVSIPAKIDNLPVKEIGKDAFYDNDSIKKVVLPSSIVTIGIGAFHYCDNLEEINLPAGLKTIGDYAFDDCDKLKTPTFPSGLETIGEYAYRRCYQFDAITIPASVKTLGRAAFDYDSAIKSVVLKGDIENLGDWVFSSNSSLTSITLPEGLTKISGGMFAYGKNLETVNIPASVKTIGSEAFRDNPNLKNANFAKGSQVESFGSSVFYNCVTLQKFTMPDTVTSIDSYCFERCTALSNIHLSSALSYIGYRAFHSCTGLETITLPDSMSKTSSDIFLDCTKLKSIDLGKGLESVGDSFLNGCTSLQEITIPDTMKTIPSYMFNNCTSLKKVTFGSNVVTINDSAFAGCSSLEEFASAPATLKNINHNALLQTKWYAMQPYGCVYIGNVLYNYKGTMAANKAIAIKEGTTKISNEAFLNRTNLTTVRIPKTLTDVDFTAIFNTCTGLETINVTAGNESYSSVDGAVYSADGTKLYYCPRGKKGEFTISENATRSYSAAFENCTKLTKLIVGAKLTSFDNCDVTTMSSLEAFEVSENNPSYSSQDGVLYNKNKTYIYNMPKAKTGAYVMPATVTGRSWYAFINAAKLTSITYNENMSCEYGRLEGCDSLQKIVIPETNTSQATKDGVLYNKDMTTVLYVPKAKSGKLVLPDSVTYIDSDNTFGNCTKLTSVTIPAALNRNLDSRFLKCYGLTEIIVSDDNTAYASENGMLFNKDKTYLYCIPAAITNVTLPDQIKNYDNMRGDVFNNCTKIKTLTLGPSFNDLYYWNFRNCPSVESIVVDANNTTYASENGVLYNKAKTQIIYVPNGYKGDLVVPNSVTSCYGNVFVGSNSLTSVTFGNTFTGSMDLDQFNYCNSLKSVTFDSNNNYYTTENGIIFNKGKNELYYYPNGKTDAEYTIPSAVSKISNNAFMNCNKIQKITVPEGVTSIDASFSGCEALTAIKIPSNVTSINENNFNDIKTHLTIEGYMDSYAEYYANTNDIIFRVLSDSVTLDKTQVITAAGRKVTLQATIDPSRTTDKTLTWTSANNQVASVDANGTVTALSAGSTTITVATADGNTATAAFQISPQLVNNSTVSDTEIIVGNSVKLTAAATGGVGKNTYAMYAKLKSSSAWTTVSSFSDTKTADFKPGKAGEYDICIKVKDAENFVENKYFTLTVADVLKNVSELGENEITIGDAAIIYGKSTGGKGAKQYEYYYKLSTEESWTTLTKYEVNTTISAFKPKKAGTYDICVKVKDAAGTIEKQYLTLNVTPTLSNETALTVDTIVVGDKLNVKAAAAGGIKDYTYAFYYKEFTAKNWVTAAKFGTTDSVEITPPTAGYYQVCVKIKDKNGAVATKYLNVVVKDKLKNNTEISSTNIVLGNEIKLKASAADGMGGYTYACLYKKKADTKWTVNANYGTTTEFTVTPKVATDYQVCVKVKDANGNITAKNFTVKVNEKLQSTSTISSTSILLGQSVKVTGSATGGTGGNTYAIFYKKAADKKWVESDYGTNSVFTITPAKATTYNICVKVKDSAGNVTKKYFDVEVKKQALANTSTVSANSIKLGDSVTVKATATGGSGKYTYAVYYKKTTDTKWVTKSNFTSTTSFSIKPSMAAQYQICVKAKDSDGTVEKVYLTVDVTK